MMFLTRMFTRRKSSHARNGELELRKVQLRKEINHLEDMLKHFNSCIEYYKRKKESRIEDPDIIEIQNENDNRPWLDGPCENIIFHIAGISCSKIEEERCVFNFHSVRSFKNGQEYQLEILEDGNGRHLGMWSMPGSLDLEPILRKYPIDNIRSLKRFLMGVKNNIDCFNIRRWQFFDFTAYLKNISRISIKDRSSGNFSRMELDMFGLRNVHTQDALNLTIYLNYRSIDALPCQVVVDWRSAEDKQLYRRKVTDKKLKNCFINFKRSFMILAFQEVLQKLTESDFEWIDENQNTFDKFSNISFFT